MFCYQCEQTRHGTGCVELGVCGKDPTTRQNTRSRGPDD
jgi:hydroxylamine reductase